MAAQPSFRSLTLTALFVFAQPMLGRRLGLAVCLCVLLFPVFLTQSGYMYVEIPLAACTVMALWAWSSGRFLQSLVWVALACWIKGTGQIVAATLLVATLLEPRPLGQRATRMAALGAVSLIFAVVPLAWIQATHGDPWAGSYASYLLDNFLRRLAKIPDLLLVSVLVLLGAGLRRRVVWQGLLVGLSNPRRPDPQALAMRRRSLTYLVVCLFFAFFVLSPLAGKTLLVLSRYYVQIVPFLMLALIDTGVALLRPRTLWASLALLMLFFVANRNGDFYPKEVTAFSIVERAGSYVDFLAVQQQGIEAIARLDPAIPVLFTLPDHYMTSDPLMGYTDNPLPNGHVITLEEPYTRGRLEDYPPHFFMLLSNAGHGGEIMTSVLKQVANHPHRIATVTREFQAGEFRTYLIEVETRETRRSHP
jgi:hypothetical protein